MRKQLNCEMCKESVRKRQLKLFVCRHCEKKFCKKPGCGEISDYGDECGTCFLKIEGKKHPLWKRTRDQVAKSFKAKSKTDNLMPRSIKLNSKALNTLDFSSTVLNLARRTTIKGLWIEVLEEGAFLKVDDIDSGIHQKSVSSTVQLKGLSLTVSGTKQHLLIRNNLPKNYKAYIYHYDNIDGKNIAFTVVLKNTSTDDFLRVRNTRATKYGLSNKDIRNKLRHWQRYYDAQLIGAELNCLVLQFPEIKSSSRRSRLSGQIL